MPRANDYADVSDSYNGRGIYLYLFPKLDLDF